MSNPIQIVQLADIHIRLYQRHDEYREVFDNLFESLKQHDYIEQLVICGDIFHNRNNLSPEGIDLFNYLMDGLNDIVGEVIIFAGNHDAVLTSNKTRLDALSPLVDTYNRDSEYQITYLKDSGVYKTKYADYALYSVLDEKEPNLSELREDQIKIGLYHGMVSGCTLDSGRVVEGDNFTVDWDEFDIFMLGDIHKYQELSKNVVYSSSLVQQNYGEHPLDHGYALWDLDSLEHEFVRVPNSYGYYKIFYEDGKFSNDYEVPENANIQLFYPSAVDFVKIKKLAMDEYPTQNINYNKLTDDEIKGDINITDEITDLFDINTIENLFVQYFGKNHELLNDLLELNRELFEENHQQIKDNFVGGSYELVSLEFDNMFAYGEGNSFNFEKNGGIAGFFSHNRSGKTSFLNTLVFALYGNANVIDKQLEMVNNKSDYYRTFLTLRKGDDLYTLERRGKVGKNGLNNKVTLMKNGESIGGTITEINKSVKELFGDYDTFYKLFYIVQQSPQMFLSLTPMERKQWLYDNLGVDIFDILHRSGKDKYNALNYKMKELLKIEFEDEFDRLDFDIADKKGKIKKINNEIDEVKGGIENIDDKIESINISDYTEEDLSEKKKELSDVITKKDKYESSIDKLSEIDVEEEIENNVSINSIQDSIKVYEEKIENFSIEIDDNKKQKYVDKIQKIKDVGGDKFNLLNKYKKEIKGVSEPTDKEVNRLEDKIDTVKSDIDDIEYEIKDINRSIKNSKENTKVLEADERFENEELCKTCPLLESAFKSKEQLGDLKGQLDFKENTLHTLEENKKNLVNELEEINKKRLLFEDYREAKESVETLKEQLSDAEDAYEKFLETEEGRLKNEKDKIKNKIESLNNELQSKIAEVRSNLQDQITQISLYEEKVSFLSDTVRRLQTEISEVENALEKDKKNQKKLNELKLTKKSLDSNLTELQEKKQIISNDLTILEKEYSDLTDKKEEYDGVKIELKLYEEYSNATHKDALPLLFVENILSVFQNEINKVISQIDDFKIMLEIEDSNVNSYMHDSRGVWSTNLASGMESFIINLAFRIAISKIGNICKPNFMIVDEGFGALDSDNQQSIPDVFRYLRSDFDHIFVVSHDDFMRDYVDYNVDIFRKDDFSHIQQ